MAGPDTRAIGPDDLVPADFPAVRHSFRILIEEEAFDAAVAHGSRDVTREVGGILVGEVCTDEQGPFVRVESTVEALHADEKGTELTFTHATWDHIHAEMDEKHPGKRVLGWYHTHPGFGVFLSDRDQFIQRSFFDLPYQIALVYDPKSREHGVFAWHEGEPRRCQRYCIGSTEHEWYPPLPRGAERQKTEEEQPMSQPANANPPEADRFSLLFGAVILLLLGGLAGWWLGGWASAGELRRTREALVRQEQSGTRELVRSLHYEILSLLRESLGDAEARPYEEGLQLIDEGLALAAESPEAAADKIRAGRDRIARHRERFDKAEQLLGDLERAARAGQLNPNQVAQAISTNAAALGQICVELADAAAGAGNTRKAVRLLNLAAKVDPEKRSLYQSKRNALKEKER